MFLPKVVLKCSFYPPFVRATPTGEVVVGRKAQRQAIQHPGSTYYSVKRLIGRRYDDPVVQEEMARLPYKVRLDAAEYCMYTSGLPYQLSAGTAPHLSRSVPPRAFHIWLKHWQ